MSQLSPYQLFPLKTLAKRMSSFGFPANLESRTAKIQKWLDFITSSDRSNDATDAEFLHEIFVDVLGYRSPFYPDNKGWELEFRPTPLPWFFLRKKLPMWWRRFSQVRSISNQNQFTIRQSG
ncbi:MAG: hypothetical protein HC770_08160 [Pseudanabaena sp. CRU_2_10]|nr:hypothetical protein [Pseudanabaena sp. CRU_2_10]